ncbi:unnamed protein product [Thlaspi arvense]|uniref:KIB1-4 beta-propeller domain-containing protein n=1 Tax=Thlaspi arvense TaxID=13288 RepID=A0AAU9S173_THLAR|nr:unnamed protein product [Thlaspi arvense]
MSMVLARRIPKVGKSRVGFSGLPLLAIRLLTTRLSSPCLLLPMDVVGDYPGGKVANLNFYDLEMQKRVTVAERRVPESIHLSRPIGSSRGWVVLMNNEDLTVHVTNMLNPSAPESSHRVISLPPLMPPDLSQPKASLQVRNVSLSSSPDNRDEVCVVAVKFRGSCISFCIVGGSKWRQGSKWRHADSLSSRCNHSLVVYSSKDYTFCLTPATNTVLRKDARKMPEPLLSFLTYYRQTGPLKQPKTGEYEYELLRRCKRTKHLVESPSGDLFIIVKYVFKTCVGRPVFPGETRDLEPTEVKTGTRRFMLYRPDPTTRVESYVQDIGDFCIFLGKNEPFILPTTMHPGLKPNSIYFTEGKQVYLYNITDQTFSQLPNDGLVSSIWLQPILH